MTAPEFRAALKALSITQKFLADKLGLDKTTVWRWARGDTPVPQYAAFTLELLHELFGPIDRS